MAYNPENYQLYSQPSYGHPTYNPSPAVPPNKTYLKPVPYTQHRPTSSLYSTDTSTSYKPLTPSTTELTHLETRDLKLKHRIRLLRIVSRILATILSGLTLAALTMTLIKYFQTRNTTFTVDGVERTAWASGTVTVYTYVYAGVALVSFVLNLSMVVSYFCGGVKKANETARYASYWSTVILVVHVLVWVGGAAVYYYGHLPKDGRFTDLWGWTCSPAAAEIQGQVKDIHYATYCTVQTTSFYTGVGNVATGVLSATIYVLVVMRIRSKKRVKRASFNVDEGREPLRG